MPRRPPSLTGIFPKLSPSNHAITSAQTTRYNCVAWVFDDTTQAWEYSTRPEKYWPPGIPQDGSVEAYVELFRNRGYAECSDATLESGLEKLALFVHERFGFGHVAWQAADGTWWSKLGDSFDITHDSLDVLEGAGLDDYGTARLIMMRPRRCTRACPF